MKTFKDFIQEARTQISPEEKEQIVRLYNKRIKETRESGANFSIHHLADETGYSHQTLRRHIFTRGVYNSIVKNIKKKEPGFEHEEMKFGAGRPKKEGKPHKWSG